MQDNSSDVLAKVVERYLFHSNFTSDNPDIVEFAHKMCDVDIWEMWVLTQK